MLILRRRLYSNQIPAENKSISSIPPQSVALQVEYLKSQRKAAEDVRAMQKLQAIERAERMKAVMKMKKEDTTKEDEGLKNLVDLKKMDNQKNPINQSLVKAKTKPVPPISMK